MSSSKYTIAEWVELYKKLPNSMKLNKGISRSVVLRFLEINHYIAPEEYIEFLTLTNGATLFDGKVEIWKIPENDKEIIPNWKSIVFMNKNDVKSDFPDIEGVVLIGGNYLGDYIGICMEDKEYDLIYISPETGESWNYYTFSDWLEELWKEMVD